jgi:predicted amidophosphoribosyltransferase
VDRITTTDCSDQGSGSAGSPFAPAIRSVLFCSCYIYSPRGGGIASEISRLLCLKLKSGDAEWLPSFVREVYEQGLRDGVFDGLFTKEAVLVPVPGSTPSAGAPWAAERLAVALHGMGLGKSVWRGVRRRFGVRKSATALNAERPTVQQHYQSFSVERSHVAPERIVLVDDVITKGRTILAAAARLHEAFTNADIRAFGLVRTMGFLPEVVHLMEPCQGFVRWAGGDARRDP